MTQTPQLPVQQSAAPPPAGPLAPHRGTTVLVLGILGLACCCFILGIIAWVMGNKDLKEMAAGRMDRSGEGTTKAGKICGMVSVIVFIIVTVIQLIVLAAGGGSLFLRMSHGV